MGVQGEYAKMTLSIFAYEMTICYKSKECALNIRRTLYYLMLEGYFSAKYL